jgi:hypothetical protein
VGLLVGSLEGLPVGTGLGFLVGTNEGTTVGVREGMVVGSALGDIEICHCVGSDDGSMESCIVKVGWNVGSGEGGIVGHGVVVG